MPVKCQLVMILWVASLSGVKAQQPTAPATEPSKTQSAPADGQAAKPASDGAAVDAAKVTGSTFESQYFKFTYELPKGWKALDDTSRVAANQMLAQAEQDRTAVPKKTTAKSSDKQTAAVAQSTKSPVGGYSLMVASPDGVESLQSPVLPRINVWASRRVPPLDSPADHVQFLMANKRSRALVRPQQVAFDGHSFVRGSVITPNGDYQSQYVTIIGDYLVGFDFRAESEREMIEMAETMKTIKFQ